MQRLQKNQEFRRLWAGIVAAAVTFAALATTATTAGAAPSNPGPFPPPAPPRPWEASYGPAQAGGSWHATGGGPLNEFITRNVTGSITAPANGICYLARIAVYQSWETNRTPRWNSPTTCDPGTPREFSFATVQPMFVLTQADIRLCTDPVDVTRCGSIVRLW